MSRIWTDAECCVADVVVRAQLLGADLLARISEQSDTFRLRPYGLMLSENGQLWAVCWRYELKVLMAYNLVQLSMLCMNDRPAAASSRPTDVQIAAALLARADLFQGLVEFQKIERCGLPKPPSHYRAYLRAEYGEDGAWLSEEHVKRATDQALRKSLTELRERITDALTRPWTSDLAYRMEKTIQDVSKGADINCPPDLRPEVDELLRWLRVRLWDVRQFLSIPQPAEKASSMEDDFNVN